MDYATIGLKRIREGISDRTPFRSMPGKISPVFYRGIPGEKFPGGGRILDAGLRAEFLSLSEDYAIVQNEDGSTFHSNKETRTRPKKSASNGLRTNWIRSCNRSAKEMQPTKYGETRISSVSPDCHAERSQGGDLVRAEEK